MTTNLSAVEPVEPLVSPATQHLRRGQNQAEAGATAQAGCNAAGRGSAVSPSEMIARLHTKLGNAHMRCGHLNLASGNYKAALRLAPHLTSSWYDLGDVNLRTGRAQDAIPLYLQL